MSNAHYKIPRWSVPLLAPSPLKGAKGGRASGKSHFFAERILEKHCQNPNFKTVCIREVQKSIKYSSYQLLKDKINTLGLSDRFTVLQTEIRDNLGNGVIIFQGMQDHTADSIKSLEGFDLAWCEEAQSLSKRSIALLIPTIRKENSEVWFSWNPDQPEDAVEQLLDDPDMVCVHVNYLDNPWCPEKSKRDAKKCQARDPDAYEHIWLGGYNVKNEAQIFNGRWRVDEFEPMPNWNPIQGLDFGFSTDPTAGVRFYVDDDTNRLLIHKAAGKVGLELDDTPRYLNSKIPGFDKEITRADSARPESISFLSRHGLPKIQAVYKWPGSVEDGIEHIKTFDDIVIHPDLKDVIDEFRLYSYVIDKKTGDPTTKINDKNNHYIDAIRYGLQPRIKQAPTMRVRSV